MDSESGLVLLIGLEFGSDGEILLLFELDSVSMLESVSGFEFFFFLFSFGERMADLG